MAYLSIEQLQSMGFKKLGRNVRVSDKASIYNPEWQEIGDNSRIDDFCVISGRVVLGRNVFIGVFCNVAGGTAGITMEDFVTLAYGCHVFAQSDDYLGKTMANSTVPAQYKCEIKKPIHIGRHAMVGTAALIFPGANLATGTAIGANSMVLQPTEPWSIYFGSPARKIKARYQDLLELEQAYLQENP